MIVKKYKLNNQTDQFEFTEEILSVTEDKAFVEMTMDLAYEKATYLYEAGKMVDDKFDIVYAWKSGNPNLFN